MMRQQHWRIIVVVRQHHWRIINPYIRTPSFVNSYSKNFQNKTALQSYFLARMSSSSSSLNVLICCKNDTNVLKKCMAIRMTTTFDDLCRKIREKLHLNESQNIVRITCQSYPAKEPERFDTVEISDDEELNLTLALIEDNHNPAQRVQAYFFVELEVAASTSQGMPTMNWSGNFSSYRLSQNMVPPTTNVVINENVSAELPQPSTTSLDEHDPVDNGGEDLGIPLSCSSETDDDDDEEIDHDVRHIIPSFQPTPLQTDLPFWSACPHFTAVNWGHPDQEQLIPSDTADHGEWKMGDALYKGLQFDTKDEVKAALACYSMNNFQSYVTKESRPTVLEVVCDKASSDGCPWVMRANTSVRTGGRWIVKKWVGPHTCFRTTTSQDHNKLSSKFVSTYILGMVKNDPSIAINMIQERVCSERRFQISYRKAWKAKQMALATVFGNWKVSYDLVNRWLPWMITKSQGSVYELQTFPYFVDGVVDEGFRQFRRLFWTFKPVVDAFNWCKPVIQIDGTFLYGKYKGTLLIATTQDGNDCVLPIAFALVEAETLSDWMWFLQNIRQHVTRRQGICLISDRHASIKSAVARSPFWQPPHAYHVYCIRHIASNFNHKFHAKALKEQLIRLGYLTCLHTFTRRYEKFCETSPEVKRWIEAISVEKWSLAHDTQGRRYGHMTTNLSEAVNKIFKGARHLPITALVKCTYERLVSYYLERGGHARAAYAQGQHYSRKLIEAMEKNQAAASTYIVKGYDVERTKFDVQEPFNHSRHQQGETWTVNLAEQTCQCGAFQAYKYPCSHAVAACAFINVNHYQYVDRAYSIMSILSAYSGTWNPLGNEETMPERSGPIIIPDPSTERRKGRPRSTRIRNEMDWPESQQSQTCRHCKAQGHNRRRCPQLVANSANNS